MKQILTLVTALCLLCGAASAETLIDDFDSYTPGQVDAATGGVWIGAPVNYAGSAILTDPADAENVLLRLTGEASQGRGVYSVLPEQARISNTQTKTVFLRFRASTGTDHSIGLSAAEAPGWFDVFGPQVAIIGGEIRVRDGGTVRALRTLDTGSTQPFYNLWIVVNNAADTVKLYLHQDGDSGAAEADRLSVAVDGAPKNTFAFRQAVADTLSRFFFFCYNTTGTVWIDDVYVMDGEELANPAMQLFKAHNPDPANGATRVPIIDTVLSWNTGLDPETLESVNPDITHHYLYFKEGDANFLHPSTTQMRIAAAGETGSYRPAQIQSDRTYSWRVDEILNNGSPSDPNSYIKGNVWTFSTIPSAAAITRNPDTVVFAEKVSETPEQWEAQIRVEFTSYQPAQVKWYKYVDGVNDLLLVNTFSGYNIDWAKYDEWNMNNSEYAVLRIMNAEQADQGSYYCIVSNKFDEDQDTTTLCTVLFKKQLSHYRFEDDFTCALGGPAGTGLNYPDANLPGPTFTGGLVGKAALFTAGNYVDLTQNAFPHAGAGSGMEAGTISLWVKPAVIGTLMANFNDNVAFEGGSLTGTTGFGFSLATASQPRMVVRGQSKNAGQFYQEIGTVQGGSKNLVTSGSWHHVATTWQTGDHMAVYVDGIRVANLTSVGTPDRYLDWQRGVLLGAARSAANRAIPTVGFAGLMDELKVFNYPLSQIEMAELYYADSGLGACFYPERFTAAYDFNGNCKIDIGDFAILAANWLDCGLYPESACQN